MTFHEVHDLEQSAVCCQLYLSHCVSPQYFQNKVFTTQKTEKKRGLFESQWEHFCRVIRLEGPRRGHQVLDHSQVCGCSSFLHINVFS